MPDPLITGGVKAAQSLERAAASTAGVPIVAELEGVAEVSAETLKYLTQTSGGPIGEVWADFGDAMRLRRWKRAMRRADKAAEFLRERGREPRHVPDSVLVPLLEGGGSEEDEAMADKWSTLLANATDPAAPEVPAAFPDVLRQLEPAEARIMDHTYEALMTIAPEFRDQVGVLKAALIPMERVPEARLAYHIDNLMRLRLIRGDDPPSARTI
jgi:hypothetical protein